MRESMAMALFERAEWIFADGKETEICDRYFEYRASFTANSALATKLYISANSQYAVYVNDHFINCGQYDDYEDYQVYDTLDITTYLKPGKNELYIGHYVCGRDFSTRRKQVPGIIFAIWSGEENLLSSDCYCLSRENKNFLKNEECISEQLGYNFEYDATAVQTEYRPSVPAEKDKKLYPRPVKKLQIQPFRAAKLSAQGLFMENDASLPKAMRMQTAYLSACREYFKEEETNVICWEVPKETRADGVYLVFDLGKESVGLLEFSLEVSDEAEVLIGFGEHLDDLRVRNAVEGRNFCFRYIARKGKNEFFYPYQRMGLRYLQFHVSNKCGKISAGIRDLRYPITRYQLPITDKLHQRIYEVGCSTLELCMHEHYEDCPWREQALYAMDSRIQILCGYYAFHEYELPRASLLLMMHSLREDGLLELCAPGRVPVNIPSFSAVFVREVLEYVEYSKDRSLAEEIFPGLKKIVDAFAERMLENSLVPQYCEEGYWNFYEWREGIDGYDWNKEERVDCLLNAFVSDAFRCFARICRILEKTELEERYFILHRAMNKAMHEMFFDEKIGAYRTFLTDKLPKHVLTQSMMLYVDAVPTGCIEKVAKTIVEGKLIPCSLSMSIYMYEALLKYSESYREYVLTEIERIWGKMLFVGADTYWETELGADDFGKGAGSLCHGWSAVPVYLLGKYFSNGGI